MFIIKVIKMLNVQLLLELINRLIEVIIHAIYGVLIMCIMFKSLILNVRKKFLKT